MTAETAVELILKATASRLRDFALTTEGSAGRKDCTVGYACKTVNSYSVQYVPLALLISTSSVNRMLLVNFCEM